MLRPLLTPKTISNHSNVAETSTILRVYFLSTKHLNSCYFQNSKSKKLIIHDKFELK